MKLEGKPKNLGIRNKKKSHNGVINKEKTSEGRHKQKKNKRQVNRLKQDIEQKIQEQEDEQENEITQWKQQNDQQRNSDEDEVNQQHEHHSAEAQIQQQNQAEHQDHVQADEGEDLNLLAQNERNLQQYQEEIGNTGVIYMSRVPPYMTPNFIRKLLDGYQVRRIYLLPESQWARKNRIKRGGSKRICFREGWIQFQDKRVAKMAALTLNGQKMVHKKGSFYSQDLWNLKYLPKFKWHNLTQKLAHEERMKKQKLRLEMDQQRKIQQYYSNQVHKSKAITGIIQQKIAKGKQLKKGSNRTYGQTSTLQEDKD